MRDMSKTRQNLPVPSFASLRAFECAARHGSFTLAAEELHLTQSAVSRQVKDLEAMLGFTLFRRNGRRVALSDAGADFASELAIDLERLKQTVTRAVAAGNARSALRIATLSTFACRWLIPRLPDFEAQNPEVEISLSARIKPFSFDEERFDLAIHYGVQDWPDTQMTKLCEEEIIAVSAPEFRDRHGLKDVNKIANAPLLHLETRPTYWSDWLRLLGQDTPHAPRGKIYDQFSMIIAAASAGLGAALCPRYLIEDELSQGNLVPLSEKPLLTNNAYYLVTPAGAVSPVAQNFTRWVKTQVSRRKTPLNKQ
ncbi:LysR substrate-binding domain-containing protein [Pseudohalocynthiibacter aestuariivivens]|jgi:LysR family transcriptional regulator, glycine cleavage system transcriptional activator|uniref:LysR substrate-binding domain-containing protein n=2 Tax=Pseudohalocynthiibacter aestuariivivens TaxID=1591409 RepID=A0ABV5JCZ7_9RHOB|nr:LysR substrate-binding domain-containing protein [Pseudohalocynthiibacter sp. F2068]MCK0103728.1 LysR substrate-binding domain-containing protein [Pseudohalocynthiibacter sp. F2068]